MHYKINSIFITLLLICAGSTKAIEMRWDWSTIDTNDISFTPDFMWGVGTSSHQIEGFKSNNWSRFEVQNKLPLSGKACDHWNNIDQDVQLIKNLGVKAYRFSIEWSDVETQPGIFNKAAIMRYRTLCEKLIAAGIEPVVTLHHFTNPIWFEDMDAFEKEANIPYFVRFCQVMFHALKDKVTMWCTINEPGIYAFSGYCPVHSVWPPAKKSAHLQAVVLKNMLKAHIAVYRALKAMPGGDRAKIGIVHSIVQFEPFHENDRSKTTSKEYMLAKLEEVAMTSWMSHFISNAVVDFFKTGNFCCKLVAPFIADVEYTDQTAPQTLDFFGLNYYSHALFDITDVKSDDIAYRSDDIKTDMPYAIYAEGLYRAIEQVAPIGVPIYITENGCPDKNDTIRQTWTERYVYALSKAIKDGFDVRGFFYWSLMDNFEWNMGYEQKFGLYEVDFKALKRTLRKGSHYYVDVVKRFSSQNLESTLSA